MEKQAEKMKNVSGCKIELVRIGLA